MAGPLRRSTENSAVHDGERGLDGLPELWHEQDQERQQNDERPPEQARRCRLAGFLQMKSNRACAESGDKLEIVLFFALSPFHAASPPRTYVLIYNCIRTWRKVKGLVITRNVGSP